MLKRSRKPYLVPAFMYFLRVSEDEEDAPKRSSQTDERGRWFQLGAFTARSFASDKLFGNECVGLT